MAARIELLLLASFLSVSTHANDRPIIGVLTVPLGSSSCVTMTEKAANSSAAAAAAATTAAGATSCFHSLYSKWLYAAGARVVPLRYDADPAELRSMVAHLNGILFTGGETNIKDLGSRYMQSAGLLLNETMKAAAAGEALPLWATCMGIQTLSLLVSQDPGILQSGAFDSEGLMLPLNLTDAAWSSRMFGASHMSSETLAIVTTEPVTTNLHHDGINPDAFRSNRALASTFDILSTNVDRQGKPFVSTIEGKDGVPVWGAQWHAERPQFEWHTTEQGKGKDVINHSAHAIRAMQYFANFFVDQTRANERKFPSGDAEAAALLYNYQPVGSTSYQAFLF